MFGQRIWGFVHSYGTPYLSQIIQPDGSKTHFIHDGTAAGLQNIVQYDPAGQQVKSILIQRDGSGRIANIFTPEHLDNNGVPNGPASVAYAYDSISNLVSVSKLLDASNPTNPVYANFQYLYTNPEFPAFADRNHRIRAGFPSCRRCSTAVVA